MLQKSAEEKYPVGPWLLALFVFVVCGSGKCRFDNVTKMKICTNLFVIKQKRNSRIQTCYFVLLWSVDIIVITSTDDLFSILLTLIFVYLQLYSRYFRALDWHSSDM